MVNLKASAAALLAATLLVSCDSNPIAPEPATPKEVAITVMATNSSPLEGAKVTCLEDCTREQIETTDELGRVTLTGFEPLTIRVEKSEYESVEKKVYNGDIIVLQTEKPKVESITIFVVDSLSADPLGGAKLTCLEGCEEGQQVEITDINGEAVLDGIRPTINIRVEKPRYVTITEREVSNGDTVALKPESEAVTMTVYPVGGSPEWVGIEGVMVSCIERCDPEGQTAITDGQGRVTLTGFQPLTVRAEKMGFITQEKEVYGGGGVRLPHEWPSESAGSFSRLNLPAGLVLNWGDPTGLLPDSITATGTYGCRQIIVRKRENRRQMLGTMEHEMFHAHQDETIESDRCSQVRHDWAATQDGLDWAAATEADTTAGLLVWVIDDFSYYLTRLHEAIAEFYKLWIRVYEPANIPDLCFSGQSERCKWFEDRFGTRPTSYP